VDSLVSREMDPVVRINGLLCEDEHVWRGEEQVDSVVSRKMDSVVRINGLCSKRTNLYDVVRNRWIRW
jgi:hypothetical protein